MSDLNELEIIELVHDTQEAENIRLMFLIQKNLHNLKNKISKLDSYVTKYDLDKNGKQKTIVRRIR